MHRRGYPVKAQSPEAYGRMLHQLLPSASIWPRGSGSALVKLLASLGGELSRIHTRADVLQDEMDPSTALELLSEFERALGLPDDCMPATATVPERRTAVISKLTQRGGQSRQYFVDLAASLGFIVTISEFVDEVARVGRLRCGDRLYGTAWAYVWRVNVDLSSPALAGYVSTVTWARVGTMRCGDRLRSWNGTLLECVFQRAKPAHTRVQFVYS